MTFIRGPFISIASRGGSAWTPQTLVVENAAPTNVVITFPSAKTVLASDFTIAAFTVLSGSWTGNIYTLVLSAAVVYGDILNVVYKSVSYPVTNNVAAPIPVYVSSVVENATTTLLEMTYNMTLANITPATTAFTVLVNGVSRTVNGVAISTTKVQLTLASAVTFGDVVTVAYTKPGSNQLQATAGGQAASITAQSVTNNALILLTVTSTGTGAGVSTLSVTVSATTTFTLDGANANFYTNAGGTLGASKTWAPTAGGTRTIYVKCTSGSSNMRISANTVTQWNGWSSVTDAASLSGDISKLTSLTYLNVQGSNTISGSIAALTSLTYVIVDGNNTISGSIAALTSLTNLAAYGNNTLTGSVAVLTSLTYLDVFGNNTISGSIAALTSLTVLVVGSTNTVSGSIAALTSLTYVLVYGSNTVSGSIAALTSLTVLNVRGSNTVSGSIAALTSLTNLTVYGSNTISGSIAALTSLTNLDVTGSNTISGDLNPIVSDLTNCNLNPCAMIDYTAGATWGNTGVTINPSATYGYSSGEIDNMLIDMAASVALKSKTITLQGSSAARTAASNAAVATLTGVGRTCTVVTN